MRKIEIIYPHRTANGDFVQRRYATDNGKDYERIVNVIHQNPYEYKVISVKHI